MNGLIPQQFNDSTPTYCKFPDGTMICWGSITLDNPSTPEGTSFSSLWYHEYAVNYPFPAPFIAAPHIMINKTAGRVCSIGWSQRTETAITEIDTIDATSAISTPATVHFIAVGRWK